MKMKKKISFSFGKGILLAFMWIISLAMFAQQITVKGTVKDTKGEPLIGVTVRVEGTSMGTITDMDGVFTLSNVPTDATLEFSYVGMKTQRIPVNGRTSIDVVMEEEAEMLEEVVVVGFGTQKKVNLTGAVSTASSREIESRPVVNVTQALQGLVPGLNISSSNGSLEAKPSVNIRGVTTIGEGSTGDPLILIDGMEGDLNSINPQDIESISVLKDAAASSIYGSRAPFGVILVTTKKGDPGKITVNYNNNFRWGSPVLKPDMMDSYTFATYFNDASINAGWSPHFSSEHLQRIKDYQEGKITYSIIPDPNNPQYWADGYAYGNDNVDWYDAIYKSSTYGQEHNFSASGGISEKTTFYTSFNYLDQNGLMKLSKDFYDRYTVSGKINSELTNWLRFGYNFRFSRENYQRPAAMTDALYWDLARQGWPTLPLYDPNGYLYSSPSPALGLATGGKDKTMTDNTYHQGFLIFEPIKNWITHVDLNYRITTAERHWDSQRTYNHDVNGNPYVYKSSSNVHEDYFNDNYFNINAYTEYSFSLNETHNLKLMAGFQAENLDRTVFGVQRDGIIVPELPEIDLTTGLDYNGNPITPSVNGSRDSWSTAGYFGRFNYDYENKYLAEINLRYDGTSRFREDQRWNLFPSFSLGWNMAQENFWETLLPTINLLKFRVSYGELGNQNTSNWYPTYQIMPVHSNEGSWLQNGTRPNTAYVPALVSSTMGWEKVENWNGGIDFGLLRNRLTGSFDYYIRRTKDMIGPAQELPAVLGIDVPKTNNTDLKTYGFDFELVWRDRLKNGLGYSAKLLLSDSQTEIR
jgi:TonB-linked SusC/RagA family outer membrane protein